MAAFFFFNTMQIDFESVLAMEHSGMAKMFKSLEDTGLKGFLEASSSVYEAAVVEFFTNAKVFAGKIISFVSSRKLALMNDVFAEAFGLSIEGLIGFLDVPSYWDPDHASRRGSGRTKTCARDDQYDQQNTNTMTIHRVFRTNQYNQDLGLIHSTNDNHLESPNEGSSIDHLVTIYLHAQNITMFPTNETDFGGDGTYAYQATQGFAIQESVLLQNLKTLNVGPTGETRRISGATTGEQHSTSDSLQKEAGETKKPEKAAVEKQKNRKEKVVPAGKKQKVVESTPMEAGSQDAPTKSKSGTNSDTDLHPLAKLKREIEVKRNKPARGTAGDQEGFNPGPIPDISAGIDKASTIGGSEANVEKGKGVLCNFDRSNPVEEHYLLVIQDVEDKALISGAGSELITVATLPSAIAFGKAAGARSNTPDKKQLGSTDGRQALALKQPTPDEEDQPQKIPTHSSPSRGSSLSGHFSVFSDLSSRDLVCGNYAQSCEQQQQLAQQYGRQRFRPRGHQFKKKSGSGSSGSGSSSSSGFMAEFCGFGGGKHPLTQCVGGQYGHYARWGRDVRPEYSLIRFVLDKSGLNQLCADMCGVAIEFRQVLESAVAGSETTSFGLVETTAFWLSARRFSCWCVSVYSAVARDQLLRSDQMLFLSILGFDPCPSGLVFVPVCVPGYHGFSAGCGVDPAGSASGGG
ncbi:hypothetical protein F511_25571 [Dorcoceras hygrometricum]|uniref:Uncharacterized protein n=1 Tax=Dorcoceras hygrometricum TaxID=472368 RepID=A0A2Z7AYR0_9LAMI|nr:hypothetical protein F511_25571 [Dorcoceras hygrometricum]